MSSIALAKVAAIPEDAEESALIERARGGDRAACDLLMRRYQRPVLALALRYVRDVEEARDVAQRAFLQVFQGLRGFRGESSLRTWIYRITVNLALDAARRERRPPPHLELEAAVLPTGAERLMREQTGERLRAAVSALPPRQRLVVELRLFDDLPFREVAEVAACSEDAARVNFHHAIRRLREILAPEGGSL